MCIICVELQKDKMTSFEARRNIIEIESELSKEHRLEILKNIWVRELGLKRKEMIRKAPRPKEKELLNTSGSC